MQTVVWIQTHLEEDVEVSLPKQEVYEEYGYYLMQFTFEVCFVSTHLKL